MNENSNGFVRITNKEIWNKLDKLNETVTIFITKVEEQQKPVNRAGSCPQNNTIDKLIKATGSIRARFIVNLLALISIIAAQVIIWFFAIR